MVYRFLLLFVVLVSNIFASANLDNLKTFKADFTQVIKNEMSKTIEYTGKVFIKNDGKVLWKYETPIIKNVYVLDDLAIVDEPELEQAIYTNLENSIDIVKLLKEAKKIDENKYETVLFNVKYLILLEGESIKSLSYTDQLENNIIISFFNIKQNTQIPNDTFIFIAPEYYDIVKR